MMASFAASVPVSKRSSSQFFSLSLQCSPWTVANSGLHRRTLMSLRANDDQLPPEKALTKKTASVPQKQLSRRDILRILSGSGLALTAYATYRSRAQFRYLSTNGVLNTLFSWRQPLRASAATGSHASDLQKFIAARDAGGDLECPEFPAGADWINSGRLSLRRELAGKVVLLDFFTYCCINCMHVLPQLAALEDMHGVDGSRGFAVVGVHSAKFAAERETANVAAAVARLGVRHPVLNDERMALWGALGVTAWPTLALLGPRANVLAVWTGEPPAADVAGVVAAALQFYGPTLSTARLPAAPAASARARAARPSPLRYPGKLAAAPGGGALFVADSANHRVLEVGLDGRVARAFGDGTPGLENGARARFRDPQGVAVAGGTLYVADAGNHAVRSVDLATGAAATLGGTGAQGFDYRGGQVGALQALSSPWDVEVADGTLYVAMAGTHQLWTLDVSRPGAPWEVLSGTGRELEKNASAARAAAWAQPSGLSLAGGDLFVADSESSSVRAVALTEGLRPTRTLAGGDGVMPENLFAFGDKDGRGAKARFQHPLAVLGDERRGLVFVADSYNHRIKTVDRSGLAKAFVGKGTPGFSDGVGGVAEFWEPSGLAMSPDGSTLYVADTNNSALRMIDIATKRVSTIEVVEGGSTAVREEQGPLIPSRRRATVSTESQNVGKRTVLSFALELPPDTHFTPGTTSRFQGSAVKTEAGSKAYAIVEAGAIAADEGTNTGSFQVNLSKIDTLPRGQDALVEVESVVYYCGDKDGVCRSDAHVFQFPVDESSAASNVTVRTNIVIPKRTSSSASRSG